jgi:hypothetical protein
MAEHASAQLELFDQPALLWGAWQSGNTAEPALKLHTLAGGQDGD